MEDASSSKIRSLAICLVHIEARRSLQFCDQTTNNLFDSQRPKEAFSSTIKPFRIGLILIAAHRSLYQLGTCSGFQFTELFEMMFKCINLQVTEESSNPHNAPQKHTIINQTKIIYTTNQTSITQL